jgi:hypothetical protein
MTTIRVVGRKPLTFKEGGLHATTGTPPGQNIPAAKIRKALAGGYGKLGVKQARFYVDVLKKGQKTAAKNRTRRTTVTHRKPVAGKGKRGSK